MSLRSKLGLFVLTREEQRAIAFIVLALVLGLLTKHYRSEHPARTSAPNELKQSGAWPGSPSPARGRSASPND